MRLFRATTRDFVTFASLERLPFEDLPSKSGGQAQRRSPYDGAALSFSANTNARTPRRTRVRRPRRAGRPAWALAAALAALTLAACAPHRRAEPDLARLYAPFAAKPKTPVIVLPGVLGSRLIDPRTGGEVWPGGTANLLVGHRLARLALPVAAGETRGELVAAGFFHDYAGQDFYGRLLATLTGPGGYHCVPASEVSADSDCVLFAWDWRRDFTEAAARLDALIERIQALRADPNLKVDLVAHSAGGLVVRYFARYGARDVLDHEPMPADISMAGARKIRRAVLIGTPNYGSISALQRALMGARVGLATIRPEVLATMPGFYELLPHPDRSWMIDVRGNRIERDLYDPATWRNYQWSVFDPAVRRRIRKSAGTRAAASSRIADLERAFASGLERGRRFHRALSIPVTDAPNEYIVFGGDCTLTPARCLLETVEGKTRIRLDPSEVRNRIEGVDYAALMLEPGDGRVTKASLLARDTLDPAQSGAGFFPIDYAVMICEEHAQLPSDVGFRDNLLNILLY
ncbi:MAG: hypothetical protein D6760_11435 [Deltaproteobacteria bacterium]|nr:MAG: hypothetical protein D6760_11435 [Deltaproteobacteria bacterium]